MLQSGPIRRNGFSCVMHTQPDKYTIMERAYDEAVQILLPKQNSAANVF